MRTSLWSGVCTLLPLLAQTTTGAQEFTRVVSCFPDIDLGHHLSAGDRAHLGLPTGSTLLSDVPADLVVMEFLNRHCFGCQLSAPCLSRAYREIQSDPTLAGKTKMVGIAVGNTAKEAEEFRTKTELGFPVIPDPKFEIYKAAGVGEKTPVTLVIRKWENGDLILVSAHNCQMETHLPLLSEVRTAHAIEWRELSKMAKRNRWPRQLPPPQLPIAGKALRAKIDTAFKQAGGVFAARMMALKDGTNVYQGRRLKVGAGKLFAKIVSRRPVCDVCHDIHFIYVFDAAGSILALEPIRLPKSCNKDFRRYDVEKLREQIVGRALSDPFDFNPEVDAITKATITCAVVYDALRNGQGVLKQLEAVRWIKR